MVLLADAIVLVGRFCHTNRRQYIPPLLGTQTYDAP